MPTTEQQYLTDLQLRLENLIVNTDPTQSHSVPTAVPNYPQAEFRECDVEVLTSPDLKGGAFEARRVIRRWRYVVFNRGAGNENALEIKNERGFYQEGNFLLVEANNVFPSFFDWSEQTNNNVNGSIQGRKPTLDGQPTTGTDPDFTKKSIRVWIDSPDGGFKDSKMNYTVHRAADPESVIYEYAFKESQIEGVFEANCIRFIMAAFPLAQAIELANVKAPRGFAYAKYQEDTANQLDGDSMTPKYRILIRDENKIGGFTWRVDAFPEQTWQV